MHSLLHLLELGDNFFLDGDEAHLPFALRDIYLWLDLLRTRLPQNSNLNPNRLKAQVEQADAEDDFEAEDGVSIDVYRAAIVLLLRLHHDEQDDHVGANEERLEHGHHVLHKNHPESDRVHRYIDHEQAQNRQLTNAQHILGFLVLACLDFDVPQLVGF